VLASQVPAGPIEAAAASYGAAWSLPRPDSHRRHSEAYRGTPKLGEEPQFDDPGWRRGRGPFGRFQPAV